MRVLSKQGKGLFRPRLVSDTLEFGYDPDAVFSADFGELTCSFFCNGIFSSPEFRKRFKSKVIVDFEHSGVYPHIGQCGDGLSQFLNFRIGLIAQNMNRHPLFSLSQARYAVVGG